MKAKRIVAFLALLAMLFTLAACNNTADPGTTTPDNSGTTTPDNTGSDTPAPASDMTLKFWSNFGASGNAFDYLEYVKAGFEKENEGVTVDVAYQGGYDAVAEKLLAAIAAKDVPHLSQLEEALLPQFSAAAEDLTKFVSQEALDRYNPGLMASSYDNGVLKAVPLARSMTMMWYNKDMFRECGLPEEGPKTWNDVYEYSKIINEKLGIYGLTGWFDSDAWYWESAVYAAGLNIVTPDGKSVDFDNEDGYRYIELMQNMAKEGLFYNTYTNQDNLSQLALEEFWNKRAAMAFDSTGGMAEKVSRAQEAGFELGACFSPADKTSACVSGGSNLIMLAGAPEEEKAVAGKMIEYLSTDDPAIQVFKMTGYLPTTTGALETQVYKDMVAEYPLYQYVIDQIGIAHARPWTRNWKEMYTAIVEELQAAMLDLNTPGREFIHNAAVKCQEILDQNA